MNYKKILVVLTVLIIGLLPISAARANGAVFTAIGQQSLPSVTVKPFSVGANSIHVNLEPYGYVATYINGTRVNSKHKVTYSERADASGNFSVQLGQALKEGDKVTLKFSDEGHFYFGQLTFESEKVQSERMQKEQEIAEQSYAEELFKRSVAEENNKGWTDRVKEEFQDAWWNFRNWLRQ